MLKELHSTRFARYMRKDKIDKCNQIYVSPVEQTLMVLSYKASLICITNKQQKKLYRSGVALPLIITENHCKTSTHCCSLCSGPYRIFFKNKHLSWINTGRKSPI